MTGTRWGVVRRASLLALAVVVAACGPKQLPQPAPVPDNAARLDAADALVSAGCLDCLLAAYREYNRARAERDPPERAAAGVVRTAALIDLRERELGLLGNDYLADARNAAASSPSLTASFSALIEIAAALRLGPDGVRSVTDDELAAMLRFATKRTEWESLLRERAALEPLAAYIWMGFACDPLSARSIDPREVQRLLGETRDTPLLAFGHLASCDRRNADALTGLLERDARFVEISYLIGLSALGLRPQPDVDAAERHFRRAYEWRQDWPFLTLSIGNLALATEDYDRAFQFFDRTLALKRADPDALVGTTRALTYLGRFADALMTIDALLATGANLGEARYWRAFSENQLGRYDAAWNDIQLASTLIVNAEVPKLAGIVAYRRGDLDVARRRLEEARTRNRADCETGFYLHMVLADRREWIGTADVASETSACFDTAEARLRENIRALAASNGEPARVARQIARREEQVVTNSRMRVTAWFNAAVALFNLGRHAEARTFATKVLDDEQFGDRARALLPRLRP